MKIIGEPLFYLVVMSPHISLRWPNHCMIYVNKPTTYSIVAFIELKKRPLLGTKKGAPNIINSSLHRGHYNFFRRTAAPPAPANFNVSLSPRLTCFFSITISYGFVRKSALSPSRYTCAS